MARKPKTPEATPAAAEAAEAKGVSVADIEGTGAGGKVTKPDVDKIEDPVVTYPLPTPDYDPNDPGPWLEETLQQLTDANARIAMLEAKVAELSEE